MPGNRKQLLHAEARSARNADLQKCVDDNVALFRGVPRVRFKTAAEKLVYLGAFNLVRQCMLPPSGQTKHNFYVFSTQSGVGMGSWPSGDA